MLRKFQGRECSGSAMGNEIEMNSGPSIVISPFDFHNLLWSFSKLLCVSRRLESLSVIDTFQRKNYEMA